MFLCFLQDKSEVTCQALGQRKTRLKSICYLISAQVKTCFDLRSTWKSTFLHIPRSSFTQKGDFCKKNSYDANCTRKVICGGSAHFSQYLRSKCFGHEHTILNIWRIKTKSCSCPENRFKVFLKCSLPQNIGRLSSTPRAFKVMIVRDVHSTACQWNFT